MFCKKGKYTNSKNKTTISMDNAAELGKIPFIVIEKEKYCLSIPDSEAQLEAMVKEHSKLIFGNDSLYFDIKKQITTKTDVGSKPDGYAISPSTNQWYIVEVELASHDPYKHILPQISKFLNGIDNHDNQKAISSWMHNRICEDPSVKATMDKITSGETYYFLTNLIALQPIVVIIVDEKTSRLNEACNRLQPKPDIIEFKTFSRDGKNHAHLLSRPEFGVPCESTTDSETTNVEFKELEGLRKNMREIAKILEKKPRKLQLLPEGDDITNLQVSNNFLDKIYSRAQKVAKKEGYHDARFCRFSVLVHPFSDETKVAIFLDFYSKLANRGYTFMIRDKDGVVDHILPDQVQSTHESISLFEVLPWKADNNWIIALRKAYLRAGKFPNNSINSEYHIAATPPDEKNMAWRFYFDDKQTGIPHTYYWSGKENEEPYNRD